MKNDEQLGIVLQFGQRPEISGMPTPGCRAPLRWTTPSCLSLLPLEVEHETEKVNLKYVFNVQGVQEMAGSPLDLGRSRKNVVIIFIDSNFEDLSELFLFLI